MDHDNKLINDICSIIINDNDGSKCGDMYTRRVYFINTFSREDYILEYCRALVENTLKWMKKNNIDIVMDKNLSLNWYVNQAILIIRDYYIKK